MLDEVVLDPGHGGVAQRGSSSPDGARFGDGRLEKQVNYALAQSVSRQLGGARLTRREGENRSLAERIEVARQRGAGAFLSLHTNPSGSSGSGVWVHSRSGPASRQLAEMISAQLAPVYGGVRVSRGDLAVLSPDRHAPGTAACLVDLGIGSGLARGMDTTAAAIARGVRGHLGRAAYGRVAPQWDRGLENQPILPSDPIGALRAISDWISRQVSFHIGVTDTSYFPFSAICKLTIDMDDGNTYVGTGFYISNDKILTAGHNVLEGGHNATRITVAPGLNGTATQAPTFTLTSSASWQKHPSWDGGTSGSEAYDMAVLKVTQPPPSGRFFDHLDATPASVGMVAICGYPLFLQAGGGDQVDDTRQRIDSDYIREVSADMETIDYNAITGWGTSGSPVFYTTAVDDPETQECRIDVGVVGVHVMGSDVQGQLHSPFNGASRLTDAKLNWIWSV